MKMLACIPFLFILVTSLHGQNDVNFLVSDHSLTSKFTGACLANAGRDTALCIELLGSDSFFLGENPVVTGGIPPYTYEWSTDYNILDLIFFTASDYLDDTTAANPRLINPNWNDEPLTFRLRVSDSAGNVCMDSVRIQFSGYGWTADYKFAHIHEGDSAQLHLSIFGGIPPYNYLWSPSTGLSDPTNPNTWASPDVNTSYSLLVIDSAGCTGTDQFDVYVFASGLDDLQNGFVHSELFPNPLTNQSVLKFTSEFTVHADILFYNQLGQLIHSIRTTDNEILLNRSAFNEGIYFYQGWLANKIGFIGKMVVK